ncbi:hypothetical protein [Paenibacillus alkalitolerans]|uniref:hypothetical protein n=1 Tax=Paenibacillus alkalitolerans TaxID=2799335 RepID=UPI0018F50225|nr:hypothetical protein [Paenibacillus alkalitolerans]
MHYCISLLINEQLQLREDQFILGGLAPDVHKYMGESKALSHFAKQGPDGNIYSDYASFFNKYLQKYYRDFWRLNGKLIDYFSLQLKELIIEPVEIDEINYRFLPELVKELYRDFELMNDAKEESLEILEFDEVLQALDKSFKTCLAELHGG